MYGGDTYGDAGASQFAGGGFMPSAGGQDNNGSAYKAAGAASSPGLWPLTIKQITQAPPGEEHITIDDQNVKVVSVVGRVISKDVKYTDASFLISDGTGVVKVAHWLESDVEENIRFESIGVNTYIRVFGHLKNYGDVMSIQSFSLRPIEDMNEITFHFLECIFLNLKLKGTQSGGAFGSGFDAPNANYGGTHTSPAKSEINAGSRYPQSPGSYAPPPPQSPVMSSNVHVKSEYSAPRAPVNEGSMDDLQGRVLAVYEDPAILELESGLSYHDVAKRVPGHSKQAIKMAIDFLVNEGQLYSTVDEDHFKATSAT